MHVSMERTVWGPSGVTRLTVNICGAARGAATREAASLETPENARVEEARRYIMVDGDGGRDRKAPMTSRTLSGAKTADAKRIQEEGKSPGLSPLRTSFSCASLKLRAGSTAEQVVGVCERG